MWLRRHPSPLTPALPPPSLNPLQGCKWRMVEQFNGRRLWGGRNWCEVTEDNETHDTLYSVRYERELGTGNMLVSNIAIPALRKP